MANQPLRLSMVITADASGVAPATAEARREIQSVTETTEHWTSSSRRVALANDQATASVRRATEATRARAAAETQLQATVRAVPTANIAAQFQDVFVTSAAGMSPIQIALQQGTQLSAVLNEIRSSGQAVGPALAGAFMSIVNPVSLVTLGLIAAASAAVQWWMSAGDSASAQEQIEGYLEAVDELNASYGRAGDAAEQFGRRTALSLAAAEDRARKLLETTREAQREALGGDLDRALYGGSTLGSALLPAFLDDSNEMAARFQPFRDAIRQLRDEIAAGNPDFAAFQQRIQEIADTDPSRLQEWANKLFELTDDAALTEQVLAKTADGLHDLSSIDPDTSRAQQAITEIGDAADRTVLRLRNLYVAGSSIKDMLDGMDALARGVAPKGDAVGGPASMDRAQEQFDAQFDLERRLGNDFGLSTSRPASARKSKVADSFKPQRDAFADMLGYTREYRREQELANRQLEAFGDIAVNAGQSLVQAFADGKLEGRELLQIVIQIIQQLMSMPGAAGGLAGLLGTVVGGGFSPTTNGFASMLGIPGRASGGPVLAGMPYIVGERRPELFVPDQNGTIIPSLAGMAGGGGGLGGVLRLVLEPSRLFDVRMEEVSGNVAQRVSVETVKQYDKTSTSRFNRDAQMSKRLGAR